MNDSDYLVLATEAAEAAFWKVIAEAFPLVKTGDLEPGATADFYCAAEGAVRKWLATNISSPSQDGGDIVEYKAVSPQDAHDAMIYTNGVLDYERHDSILRGRGYHFIPSMVCSCQGNDDDGHLPCCGWGRAC